MKRLLTIGLGALLMLVSLDAAAQEGQGFLDNAPDKPFEIVLSYGGTPYHHYRFSTASGILPTILVHRQGKYDTEEKTTPSLNLEAAWYFNPRMAVTQLFSYHKMETGFQLWGKTDTGSHGEKVIEQTPYLIYMTGFRYLYVKKPHFRLYGEVAGGYVWKDKNLEYFELFPGEGSRGFTGQIIPVGLQTTGRLFINAELFGFGEYANIDLSRPTLGITFGLGYRF